MKRFLAIIVLLVAASASVWAQQLPIFSLYKDNSFVLNPAIAGSEDHGVLSFTFRDQWAKVKDSPQTESLNFRMPIYRSNVGLGGQLINDKTGPTSFTGASFSYAYHISFYKINPFIFPTWFRNSKFSIGLSASLYQYRLNASDLVLDQPNDQAISSADNVQFMPNAGVGFYYYYDYFYLGFSAPQLIPLSTKFSDDNGTSSVKRINHYYTVIGGTIPLGDPGLYEEMFSIEPMLWFKAVKGAPMQFDLHTRLKYKRMVWLGVGYRTSNTMILEAGALINKRLQLGYTYDLGISSLAPYIGGSHELLVAVHFNRGWKHRRRR